MEDDISRQQHKYISPPKWIDYLLESFCAPHLLEEVQGDMHELYGKWVEQWSEKSTVALCNSCS